MTRPPLDAPAAFSQYAGMKRTTISLPDDLSAALEREAGRRRVPVSQVAREALESHLGLTAKGERELPFIGMFDGELGPGGSEDLEKYLAQERDKDIERDAFLGSR